MKAQRGQVSTDEAERAAVLVPLAKPLPSLQYAGEGADANERPRYSDANTKMSPRNYSEPDLNRSPRLYENRDYDRQVFLLCIEDLFVLLPLSEKY